MKPSTFARKQLERGKTELMAVATMRERYKLPLAECLAIVRAEKSPAPEAPRPPRPARGTPEADLIEALEAFLSAWEGRNTLVAISLRRAIEDLLNAFAYPTGAQTGAQPLKAASLSGNP